MHEHRTQRLSLFVDWASQHISGDEKGEAQIFLDRLFQSFGQPGLLEVGGHPEFRIREPSDDGGTCRLRCTRRVLCPVLRRFQAMARGTSEE